MFRTILFKIILGIYFTLWAPFLLLGLTSSKLSRKLVNMDAAGVLVVARLIAGIKYKVHYPSESENGIPNLPNGNKRLDGKSIIAAKHMSILEIAVIAQVVPNIFYPKPRIAMDTDLWLGFLACGHDWRQSRTRQNKHETIGNHG